MTYSLTPALLLAALAILFGCNVHSAAAPPRVPGPPPPQLPRQTSPLFVGTARADLTLPPGGASFGYAPDSRVTHGYWTRIYCRVFYFETAAGQKLALVPCELPFISGLLQRHVAALVSDHLHASQLMMTATHTHAGPAHHFGARQFTGLFSTRMPGFDERVLFHLSRTIGDAVKRAIVDKRPAKVSWRHEASLWCQTHNRSLAAYRLNRDKYAPAHVAACAGNVPELAAIDPSVDVLRIDRIDPSSPERVLGPIGSISLLAMHPTVLHNTNQLYGGDAMGVMSRYVEGKLRSEVAAAEPTVERDPLHGIINTNEGDLAPISNGDIAEAIRTGTEIAEIVWKAHPPASEGSPTTVLDHRYIEEDITRAKFHDGERTRQLCEFGELGEGAARGSSEHPSYISGLSIFSTDPPLRFGATRCHSPKIALLGPLSLVSRAPGALPTNLPLAVVTLGDTLMAFVPAELTVTAGHRVKERIRKELADFPEAPKHAVIAGLANEYIEYVATSEEYQLQAYEGASTLFGPDSAGYFTDRFGVLARSLFDRRAVDALRSHGLELGVAREVHYGYGPTLNTGIFDESGGYRRQLLDACTMPQSPGAHWPPQLCMYWLDGGPGDVPIMNSPWIQVVFGEAVPPGLDLLTVDDRGLDFQTRAHAELERGVVWSTLYSPSKAAWSALRNVPFALRSNGRPALQTTTIAVGSLPHLCSVKQARICTTAAETDDWEGLVPRVVRPPLHTRAGRFEQD